MELYHEVLNSMKASTKEQIAEFFNTTTDTMGNHLLHVCASYGACKPGLLVPCGDPADNSQTMLWTNYSISSSSNVIP